MPETTRFVLFVLTSGASAVINAAVRYALTPGLGYEAAVAVAYLVGVVVAFLLARSFVFSQSQGSWRGQFGRFLVVNGIGFAQVWLLSVGLTRLVFPWLGFTWQAETVAHLVGLGSLAATSFFLHRAFSFADQAPRAEAVRASTRPPERPAPPREAVQRECERSVS